MDCCFVCEKSVLCCGAEFGITYFRLHDICLWHESVVWDEGRESIIKVGERHICLFKQGEMVGVQPFFCRLIVMRGMGGSFVIAEVKQRHESCDKTNHDESE